jgi:CHAT domain
MHKLRSLTTMTDREQTVSRKYTVLINAVKKILILTANPKDTAKLRLDEEIRAIQAVLKRAKNREKYEIVTEWAVRVDDLRRALLEHQPTIVHFSGHGSGSTGLALENSSGQVQLVSTESLAKLFGLFQETIECVLLNACYSQAQIEAIHQHIDYVVGMNRAIGDAAAIEFAIGFYDALLSGRSYEDCFEVGCASIDLQGIPESEIPVLKARRRLLSSLDEETRNKQTQGKTNSEGMVWAESEENNSPPKYYGGLTQSMSGVQIHGGGMQVVQGNYNKQNMSYRSNASASEKPLTQQEVIQFLLQIEQFIQSASALPVATKEKSLRYLGVALEEVRSHEPDKYLAAGNLKRMTEILKTSGAALESMFQALIQLSVWLDVPKNFFSF